MRDKKIDIAKSIGITLVVLGHAGFPYSSIIFRFHMALFFALSGWCFNDKNIADARSLLKFICKKIKTLYIPFVLFNGIILLLRNCLISMNIYTDNELFLQETAEGGNEYGLMLPFSPDEIKVSFINILKFTGETQLGGAMWFLRVLFGIAIFWAVINYVIVKVCEFDDRKRLAINLVISAFLIWVSYNWLKESRILPMQFETVSSVYPIYTIGYYLKKYYPKTNIRQDCFLAALSFIILYYCDKICTQNGWNSNVRYFDDPFMYIASSLSGIILIISISSMISQYSHTRFLEYIGKHTLSIMIWHFLAFKFVALTQCVIMNEPFYRIASFPVFKYSHGWWLVYTMAGICIPLGISHIYGCTKNQEPV